MEVGVPAFNLYVYVISVFKLSVLLLHLRENWYKAELKLFMFFCSFLQEVGYTDSVLAVRQNRVRQLLCAANGEVSEPEAVNGIKQRYAHDNPHLYSSYFAAYYFFPF